MYWYHSITFGVCSVCLYNPHKSPVLRNPAAQTVMAILSASPQFLHQVLLSFIGLRPRGLKTFIKIDITLISIKINYFEDLNSHCIWAETSVAYLQNVKFLLH